MTDGIEPRALTILQLAANRWWTGSADPVIRLAAGLRDRGHRVLLGVIPGDRFEAKAREAGLEPIADFSLRTRGGPAALLRDLRLVRSLVADEGVDLVHTHHSHDHWLAVLGRPHAGRAVPVMRTFHARRAVKRERIAGWLYARTAAMFAVSRQIEGRCHDVGIPPARVVRTPGLVDLARFAPPQDGRAVREEFKLGSAPVVVTVSRLAPSRGHELLLASFRLLLDAVPEAHLLLVGKGEARDRLEQLVAELELGQRVFFTGYRDRDLPAVLAAADCFALMAAGSDESCRAALEAMAASRPVVARAVGALPETVVHGETGLLVDDDAPASFAAALASILTDRARGWAMGRAGRARAESEFGAERAVTIVEAVYRSLA